ncbi:holo-ACP synthase [Bradyrhizobium erythrophlei]|uniref:Holo-[acyl-carrier protein] synthase n=1 Tax=Bradyrhizobium erythrophlei TaxID=1437360 RepID=A0A1M7UN31_9BRAD|nr:holo-ACP synthase [Bradyrhizobium erythrophlei]SHN84296.1 holo-[acyl-carrier protein] synthase [Bradyrhizobium erythrophlei]
MILGVGVDLCQVERIRRSLRGLGEAWIDELFTAEERRLCQLGADHALLFGRAFCGKEACFKALGTENTAEVGWRDIEILQSGSLASARLSGGALQRLQEITPPGHVVRVHVACAGGAGLAQAIVTISAVPVP